MPPHNEIEVGGVLDEARLVAILDRAASLRNQLLFEGEAHLHLHDPTEIQPFGETPTVVHRSGDGGETRHDSIELHVGCGEICGVLAVCPWDHDASGLHPDVANAIAHAGADLFDMAREVVRLRALINAGVGATMIAAERRRQLEVEGYGADHDDEHDSGELAVRAAELALDGIGGATLAHSEDSHWRADDWGLVAKHRPDRVRQLTVAGALIAAEIDRLQRVAVTAKVDR